MITETLHERRTARLEQSADGRREWPVAEYGGKDLEFGQQLRRVATSMRSADALFVERIRDIVGLYLNPPTKAPVLCVDEKS